MDSTILSIARLHSWILFVIKFLKVDEKRRGGIQTNYVTVFSTKLPEATYQIKGYISSYVDLREERELILPDFYRQIVLKKGKKQY